MEKRNKDILKRSRILSNTQRGIGPVVYWMYRDQRTDDNWALLYAQEEAKIRNKALLVLFSGNRTEMSLNRTQQPLFIHGLQQIQKDLQNLNIPFIYSEKSVLELLPTLHEHLNIHCLITDFSPLRKKKSLNNKIIQMQLAPLIEVDAHNIVPAWQASSKKEYAAYTIRPKINKLLDQFLTPFPHLKPQHSKEIDTLSTTLSKLQHLSSEIPGTEKIYEKSPLDRSYDFIENRLSFYKQHRNDPCKKAQSNLSGFLHFGHLSAQRLALETLRRKNEQEAKDVFLEELIIRRELADNFCLYENSYDQFAGFPEWGKKTLKQHAADIRQYQYTLKQFNDSKTHDPIWNKCQTNLRNSGRIHGYLRMYWAKKILEWSATPAEALSYAIYLNDTYSIDGYDPNGYTGIAWSIGGVHDRAWPERPIFGKIRYMNDKGCKRKFDVKQYLSQDHRLF